MRNCTIILLIAFVALSFQSTEYSTDFSSPKSLIETFFSASANMDKDVLSTCFSDQSPGEWDAFRDKTISEKDLKDVKEFLSGAQITKVEMEGESKAIVFVTLTSRDEKIHTIRKEGRWYILDF